MDDDCPVAERGLRTYLNHLKKGKKMFCSVWKPAWAFWLTRYTVFSAYLLNCRKEGGEMGTLRGRIESRKKVEGGSAGKQKGEREGGKTERKGFGFHSRGTSLT